MIRAAAVLLALLACTSAAADATTYRVDPKASELVVRLWRAGLAARLGHDHVVAATASSGTITHDPARADACQVSVDVDARTLVADDPALRRRYRLDGTLSASDRASVQKNLAAPGQLYTARHRWIRFRSSRCRQSEEQRAAGRYALEGTLEVRGVRKAVTLVVAVTRAADGKTLTGVGRLRFLQSQFGYQPYSALLGAIAVQDAVVLHVRLVARVPPPPEEERRDD